MQVKSAIKKGRMIIMVKINEYMIRVYKIKTIRGKGFLYNKIEEFMNKHNLDEDCMMLFINEYEEDILSALAKKTFKENGKIGYIFAILENHVEEFTGYLNMEQRAEKENLLLEIRKLVLKIVKKKPMCAYTPSGNILFYIFLNEAENIRLCLNLWYREMFIFKDDKNKTISIDSSIEELRGLKAYIEEHNIIDTEVINEDVVNHS